MVASGGWKVGDGAHRLTVMKDPGGLHGRNKTPRWRRRGIPGLEKRETWGTRQLAYDLAQARKDESKIKVRRQRMLQELHA